MGILTELKRRYSKNIEELDTATEEYRPTVSKIKDTIKESKEKAKKLEEERVARAGFKRGLEEAGYKEAIKMRPQIVQVQSQPQIIQQVRPRKRGFMSGSFMETDPFSGSSPFFPKKKR